MKRQLVAVLWIVTSWVLYAAASHGAVLRDIETTYSYDTYGNITTVKRTTGDSYSDTRTSAYVPADTASWLVGTLQDSTESSSSSDGETVSRTFHFDSDKNTGALTDEVLEPGGTESTYEITRYDRDKHGVLYSEELNDVSGEQARAFSLRFDTLEDLFPISETNSLGQTELFAAYPAFAVLVGYEDPNGVVERRQLDGFGRLRHVVASDGDDVTIAYSDKSPEIHAQLADGQSFDIVYDVLRNEIRRSRLGFDGAVINTLTIYNSQNLIAEKDGPCRAGAPLCAAAASERYSYDELGRLTGVTHSDNSSQSTLHSGLMTTSLDELQNRSYVVQNQSGQIIKSVAVSDLNQELVTTFVYGPFDTLRHVTDPGGNTSTAEYDVRGRRTRFADPDSGNHIYRWTAFDDLQSSEDADGDSTIYVRDVLGRPRTIVTKDGTTTFNWDTAPNGIGKLSDAVSPDQIVTSYSYDSKGRISQTKWKVEGRTYRAKTGYDSVGRMAEITYPSAADQAPFTVRQEYNPADFLARIIDERSSEILWQANQENERGQVTAETQADGWITRRTYTSRGFLISIEATVGGVTREKDIYSYLSNGALKSRIDYTNTGPVTETFGYDFLDRLSLWTVASSAEMLLQQKFKYDEIGNLISRITSAGTGPSLQYRYGHGIRPHGVTEVNGGKYQYNPDGDQNSGPTRTVDYNANDFLAKMKQAARLESFKYDAEGRQVLNARENGDTVTHLGGLYERRLIGGQATDVFYVQASPGRIVAQASANWQNTLLFHSDRLGSLEAVTDRKGAIKEQLWYEPFGQTFDPLRPGVYPTDHLANVTLGFTGHREDVQSTLISMNARFYDPAIGIFLTPDPIVQDPLKSQSFNRYSYAWNNPLKWTDPSGLDDEPPSEGGIDPETSIPALPCTSCTTGSEPMLDEEGPDEYGPPVPIEPQSPPESPSPAPMEVADDTGLTPLPSIDAQQGPGLWAPRPEDDWRRLLRLELPPEQLTQAIPLASASQLVPAYAIVKHFKDLFVDIWKFATNHPDPIFPGANGSLIYETPEKLGFGAEKGIFELGMLALPMVGPETSIAEATPEIRLGLGLQTENYRAWAAQRGLQVWDEIGQGATDLERLNDALSHATELHFNTEGLRPDLLKFGTEINQFGEPAVGWTNYELTMIRNQYADKVFWWYGRIQDMLFQPW